MTEAPADQRKRILIVEDDESLRTLVGIYLDKKGYRVESVGDGAQALAALGRGGFDLCLLDVMMPNLGGVEVLTQARARGDNTPMIMATAVAKPEEIARALEGGADDYVTKPYSLQVLAARIALRIRAARVVHAAPVPVAHTLDLPIDVVLAGAHAHATEGAEAGAVESAAAEIAIDDALILDTAPAADERSLFARLRSAADVFKRRKESSIELGPGARLAERYELGPVIGEGGYGVVFKARHLDLGHDVAVKVLRAGSGGALSSAGAIDAFRREAQNACRVRHEHAVRVLDFGLERGLAFFVMELLDGPSAEDEVLAHGALDVARAATIAKSVLSALGAAHALGIVHRDVKPHNVVLHREASNGREVPKLLDFGIAKSLGEKDAAGVVAGSAAFIAPERLLLKPYDGRADIYSLGVVLYRMLTGALPSPYAVDDFENLVRFHLHEQPAPPSSRRAGLSRTVDKTVLRLMEKDPQLRPQVDEAEALVEQLVWESQLG